jgi:two-component system, chemotaxis family, protein-glutamate methylesterase/glutaminase
MSPPGPKVRVLVVDDSVTIRRLLVDGLSQDPEIEVVGSAANGKIALAKICQSPPDVVTLDVEMPEMDGLQTLAEIRKTHPKLPVVMFSSLTERAASTTLEALARGATDYMTKPTGEGSLTASMRIIREVLAKRLKSLVRPTVVSSPPPRPAIVTGPIKVPVAIPKRTGRPELLAIGASTGGPNAIADVLMHLRPLPVPGIITQHMPPIFTRLFAQRLSVNTPHKVREATDGDVLEPGLFLIAPGDYHMVFRREGAKTVVKLTQDPPENSCRPAVDPMLRSAVELYGGSILAVILTGMGQDGLRGCELIRAAGGDVIAQDEASSVVWGMPGYVARAGLAGTVAPLSSIASHIAARFPMGSATLRNEVDHVTR